MKMAAIYARVSSEQQRDANTIASQTASLLEFAKNQDLEVPKEWVFEDDGYSGATLERPGLEHVRDLAELLLHVSKHLQLLVPGIPVRYDAQHQPAQPPGQGRSVPCRSGVPPEPDLVRAAA